jgi:hypothetical protein
MPEVQQWLESTKLNLTAVDLDLHDSAVIMVKSRLASEGVYDVSGWTNDTNTPSLIRKIISLFIAAWLYNRAYSEDAEQDNKYANRLEAMAHNMLSGLEKGEYILTDYTGTTPGLPPDQPEYYPSDVSSGAQIFDARGNLIGDDGAEDIKFWMGMTK